MSRGRLVASRYIIGRASQYLREPGAAWHIVTHVSIIVPWGPILIAVLALFIVIACPGIQTVLALNAMSHFGPTHPQGMSTI